MGQNAGPSTLELTNSVSSFAQDDKRSALKEYADTLAG